MRRKRNRKRINNRFEINLSSKLVILTVGLYIVLQIFSAIQASSTGAVLADLEKREMKLINQNERLANQIVDQNSLIQIREQSEELGYSSPQATFYITEQDTVALLK